MQPASTSRVEVAAYLRQMQPLIDLWSHITRQMVNELTSMPMRRMMGAHVEHLQSLYRGALDLTVPAGCRPAHKAFLAAIGTTIDAYLATAEQSGNEQDHQTMLGAIRAYHFWRSEVARLAPPELN